MERRKRYQTKKMAQEQNLKTFLVDRIEQVKS